MFRDTFVTFDQKCAKMNNTLVIFLLKHSRQSSEVAANRVNESSYWDDLRSEGKSEESFKDRVEHSPPGRRTPTRTGTGKI